MRFVPTVELLGAEVEIEPVAAGWRHAFLQLADERLGQFDIVQPDMQRPVRGQARGGAEYLRVLLTYRASQPDVEKVGEVCVSNVVVIGRVG